MPAGRNRETPMTRLFAGTPFDIPPECPACGGQESQCGCLPSAKDAARAAAAARQQREAARLPPEKQTATVVVERRPGGRRATVVAGLSAAANDLPALLQRLQACCGAGGTVKLRAGEGRVELQGDHAVQVRTVLGAMGYRVR